MGAKRDRISALLAKLPSWSDIGKLGLLDRLTMEGHINKAIYNTWGKDINPEAVPDLLEACKLALWVMEKNERIEGMDFGVEKIPLKNAIAKAEGNGNV